MSEVGPCSKRCSSKLEQNPVQNVSVPKLLCFTSLLEPFAIWSPNRILSSLTEPQWPHNWEVGSAACTQGWGGRGAAGWGWHTELRVKGQRKHCSADQQLRENSSASAEFKEQEKIPFSSQIKSKREADALSFYIFISVSLLMCLTGEPTGEIKFWFCPSFLCGN